MPWYTQLDNNGKETTIKRFFTDKEVTALESIWKKTKRVRWVKTDAPNGVGAGQKQVTMQPEKKKPAVSLVEVHNAETEKELKALLLKADTESVKAAIKKRIESLTKSK